MYTNKSQVKAQRPILMPKDKDVEIREGNKKKKCKKHVTFRRYVDYYTYAENGQMELDIRTCSFLNDDWVLSEIPAQGKGP